MITSLQQLLREESENAARTLREYPVHALHAEKSALLVSNFIQSAMESREIFSRYYALLKKHHTLALFSTLRLHQVQAAMNLRQSLEAGVKAAYALANPDPAFHFELAEDGSITVSAKLRDKPYQWLDEHAAAGSAETKKIKRHINETMSHANLVNSHSVFINNNDDRYSLPFFDIEDNFHQKIHLWQNANIGLHLVDLLSWAKSLKGGIELRGGALAEWAELSRENALLGVELKSSPRVIAANDASKRL